LIIWNSVFSGHLPYVALAVLVSAAAGAVLGTVLRFRSDRPWAYAGWASFTLLALMLTWWVSGGIPSSGGCVINKDVGEPLGTPEGLMNLVMFVPIGFFGSRAARHPLPALLISALLSFVIEGVQAGIPAIGRHCDTSDLVTNVVGAVVGIGISELAARGFGRRPAPWTVRHRSVFVLTGSGFAAIAAAVAVAGGFRIVDHAEGTRAASAEQRAAVSLVVRQALGDGYRLTEATDNTPLDQPESVEAGFRQTPAGKTAAPDVTPVSVIMNWPGQDAIIFIQDLDGLPVPGSSVPVHDITSARHLADRYVATTAFGPAVTVTSPSVTRPDAGAPDGWIVAYPYHSGSAPKVASLRIALNSAGHLVGVRLSTTPPRTPGEA
jgi:uncharacterized membrane protein